MVTKINKKIFLKFLKSIDKKNEVFYQYRLHISYNALYCIVGSFLNLIAYIMYILTIKKGKSNEK